MRVAPPSIAAHVPTSPTDVAVLHALMSGGDFGRWYSYSEQLDATPRSNTSPTTPLLLDFSLKVGTNRR